MGVDEMATTIFWFTSLTIGDQAKMTDSRKFHHFVLNPILIKFTNLVWAISFGEKINVKWVYLPYSEAEQNGNMEMNVDNVGDDVT